VNTELAVSAAIGCALCNAFAAILQKVSSDKVGAIKSYNVSVMLRLFRQLPYAAGIVLDLLAGIFTLIAVNRLPLFIVQAIIASCVVLTAFLEQLLLKRKLGRQIYSAAAVALVGLGCLALASHSEKTASVGVPVKDSIVAAPVLLLAVGAIVLKVKSRLSTFVLAGLSGAAFGGVSIIGRLLVYPNPLWMVAKNSLFLALLVYGALGVFFFTTALQRTLATVVNGVMTSAQTLIPLLVGIIFLGDTARNGLWALVWIGCLLVVD
jgi:drug/metabolite transporter (DMT)-like permease